MMTLQQERLLPQAEKAARAITGRRTGDEIQVNIGNTHFWFMKHHKSVILIEAMDWDAPKRGRRKKNEQADM